MCSVLNPIPAIIFEYKDVSGKIMLLAKPYPKNAKKHSYYASESDGSSVHIDRYFYPGELIPNMFTMHGKQYKRGKFTKGFKDSAESKTLSPSQALAQEKHQNSVVRNDTKDRIVLRVLNNEMSQEEAGCTVILTWSAALLSCPSFTTNSKRNVVSCATVGAVNTG